MDQLLSVAIQAAFLAVFGVTLLRYLRDRSPLNRDVLVVFAAIAGLFATQLLTAWNSPWAPHWSSPRCSCW